MKRGSQLIEEAPVIKHFYIAAVILVFACAVTVAQLRETSPDSGENASTSADVGQDLVNIETEWHRALERADTEALDRILGRDWFITNGSGRMIPKAELLQGLRAGDIRFVSTTPTNITVHAYGDAAVVTKRSTDKTLYGSTPGGGTYQMTDMFVKLGGHWQCVATHASRDLTAQQ